MSGLVSFNGRTTPAAVPTAGDYAASQVTNDSAVSGAFVANALNTVNTYAHQAAWTWANSAARLAQSVAAADVGLVGYQQDMNLRFRLVAVSPSVWSRQEDGTFDPWASSRGAQGAITDQGMSIFNAAGAGTFGVVVPGNASRSDGRQRISFTTLAAAGSTAYARTATGGRSIGLLGQGWRYRLCAVPSAVSAGMRWVYGIYDTLALPLTVIDPSVAGTLLNCLAMGCDRTINDNLRLYFNDAAGAPTQVDLGASFPGATVKEGYELELYSVDGSSVVYNVLRLNNRDEVSGSVAANLPLPATSLKHGAYSTNNAAAVAVSVDFSYATVQQSLR